MTVRQKGRKFMADFMYKGKRYREVFETYDAAEAWELDSRARLIKGLEPSSILKTGTKVSTLRELVDFVYQVRWNNRKSKQPERSRVKYLYEHYGPDTAIQDVLNTKRIGEFVADRLKHGNSGATVNRYLSLLNILAQYAVDLGLIDRKPKMPWQKDGAGRTYFFTHEEVDEIAATARKWGYDQYADLFIFLAYTGFRVGEALRAEWSDIREDTITCWVNKADLPRTIGLTPEVKEVLANQRGNNRGPFCNLNGKAVLRVFTRVKEFLELPDEAVVHTFRHTRASWFALAGEPLLNIQIWMGHKDIKSTLRYAHLSPKAMVDMASRGRDKGGDNVRHL